MRNAFKFILFFAILLTFTGCFDILDKVSMNADGSGDYTIILNASKSKTRLASISKMNTINGKKVPKKSEIESKLQQAAAIFKSVPGISNVKTSADFNNYIIKLNCNFKKIENINDGIEQLKSKKIIGKIFPSQLYSSSAAGKTFTKNKINSYKKDYDKLSTADKEIFNAAKYTSILQFQNTINSQSNSDYQISPNKKALKLDGNILDFILQKKQIHNTISFK